MNPQLSSCAALNAVTHSENTHRLSDFKGKILKLAFELRNRGYSEAYLATLIRALNFIAARAELENRDFARSLFTLIHIQNRIDYTAKSIPL